jgi:hypothetical protein
MIGANQTIAATMGKTSNVMKKMNDQNKSEELMKNLNEFSKQSNIMNMKDEIINDTLAEALEDSDQEEEENAVINSVLDEIGIEITSKLGESGVPEKSVKLKDTKESKKNDEITDDYVERALAQLKM